MAKKPEPDGETRNPNFLGRGGACLLGFGAGFGALTGIFIGFGAGTGLNIPAPPRPETYIYTHQIYLYTIIHIVVHWYLPNKNIIL